MALQGTAFSPDLKSSPSFSEYKNTKPDKEKIGFPAKSTNGLKGSIVHERYSAQKYALEFTSKDGDKVSFSVESIEYQKNSIEFSANGSKDDFNKLKTFVKDELRKMSKEIVKGFLKDAGIQNTDNENVNDIDSSDIPEYWNAENTSQRIVDFATSFFGAFKGDKGEFLSKIKEAIEKGFDQAKKMWGGEFPKAASNLVKNTHDLIMEKLDEWAGEGNDSAENENLSSNV